MISPITFLAEAHVSNASNNVAGNQTCNVPSGVADGDLIMALVYKAQDSVHTLTAPAGWTSLDAAVNLAEINASTWYRIASSEPASYTWNVSSTGIWGVCQFAFRGVDPANPFQNHGTANATTTNPISTPAVDMPNPGGLVVSMIGDATSTTTEETHSINTGTAVADFGFDGGISARNGAVFYGPVQTTPQTAVSYSITGASGTLTRRIVFAAALKPFSQPTGISPVTYVSMMTASNW